MQSNGNSRQASWHYQVDDKQIIQSFPDTAICWHAEKGNSQSIGIEICVNSDGDFQKAVENAVLLVKVLMGRYNLNTSRVVQHNFWTGKNCPRHLRSGAKGINWTQFKSMLNEPTNSPSSYLVLKYGDVGDRVKLYQDKLKRAGYLILIDGSFGPAMRSVVQQFQRDNGLVVDGFLGPVTQKKLNEILIALRNKLREDEQLNLNKNERAEIARIFKKARESGVFSSAEHEKTIVDGTMTVSRLQYLLAIIAGAGINGGKRIK